MAQVKGQELTKGGKKCLSKAFLDHAITRMNGLEVYGHYFLPFVLFDDNSNLSSLKARPRIEEKLRKSMYKISEPLENPGFFDFNSYHDINRFCKAFNVEVVIYYSDSSSKMSICEIFHDFRTFSNPTKKVKETIYFLVTAAKELFKLAESLDSFVDASPYFFAKDSVVKKFGVGGKSISSAVAELSVELDSNVLRQDVDPRFADKGDVARFIGLSANLFGLWKETVLVVSFCRSFFLQCSDFSKRGFARRDPKKLYFSTVAIIASPEQLEIGVGSLKLDSEVDKVVCLFGNNSVCLLEKRYAKSVLSSFAKTNNKDRLNDANYQGIPFVSEAERVAAEEKFRAKKKPTQADGKVKKCKCSVCQSGSKNYERNMSKAGPERLCTVELDASELLEMLCADTSENINALEKMCHLSVAAMDIESMTLPLNLDRPENVLSYASIDTASLEGHAMKIQKPIMIAHVDELSVGSPSEETTLTAESDEEESIYDMMKKYWKMVLRRHTAVMEEKKKIAAPILDLVQLYKTRHFEFFNTWSATKFKLDIGVAAKSWWQTLTGKLEKKMKQLIADYNVFSFYG